MSGWFVVDPNNFLNPNDKEDKPLTPSEEETTMRVARAEVITIAIAGSLIIAGVWWGLEQPQCVAMGNGKPEAIMTSWRLGPFSGSYRISYVEGSSTPVEPDMPACKAPLQSQGRGFSGLK